MPELPEVETIRRDLEKEVVGKRVKAVEIAEMRAIRRHPNKKHFIAKLEGQKLGAVDRKGMYLTLEVGADDILVVDLGSSGRLVRAANRDAVPKSASVVVTFTQSGQLRFLDAKGSGEIFVISKEALAEEVPELDELGYDPVEDVMSWTAFGEMLLSRKVKLKQLLMDQRFVAGIGTVYSDEILFAAGLRHDRGSDSLTTQEVRRLYRAVGETLHDALKHRGASVGEPEYVDLFGAPGEAQREFKVYGREGEACRRCRAVVVKQKWSGRSVFLCEQCQV